MTLFPAAPVAPYAALAFAGSFLLFWIELMAAKLLLPFFGGSAQVWTTCMLFFQGTLLAGYLYSHLAGTRLSGRRQALLHLAVLAAAVLVFPVSPAPSGAASPAAALLASLALSIGAPFFALSATVPTIQRWLSRSSGPGREDAYTLYAASNAGALAALLAFPFLLEPLLPLDRQVLAWEALYGLFAAGHLACFPRADSPPEAGRGAPRVPIGMFLSWVALSAGPCAALLAATAYLTTTLAAVPLLWVVPLGLYLLTFVLNFKARPWKPGRAWKAVFLASGGAAVLAAGAGTVQNVLRGEGFFVNLLGVLGLLLHPAAIFTVAMVCHRSLAESRPAGKDPSSLYYLAISVGGLLGSILLGVATPALGRATTWLGLDWAVAGTLCLPAIVLGDRGSRRWRSLVRPAFLACCALVAAAAFSTQSQGAGTIVYAVRNFYGTSTVVDKRRFRRLLHGKTIHGMQRLSAPGADLLRSPGVPDPLSYYHRQGPLGDVFRLLGSGFRDVGAVGLGAGSLASYGRPGTTVAFFELDPDVAAIARKYFSFLEASPAAVRVVTGDGRLSLEREPDASFDLLVIDAFGNGVIPTHLLTREAFELYFRRLRPKGVLLFHISNKHLDLKPVLALNAQALGATGAARYAEPPMELLREFQKTEWAAVSMDREPMRRLVREAGWDALAPGASRLRSPWTDRSASLLPILKL